MEAQCSLKLLKQLESCLSKVRLYTHEKNQNKGPGPSRNLAIGHATQEYISFLDADDEFLPNRFQKTNLLFQDPNLYDAIYEPVIINFPKGHENYYGFKIKNYKSYNYLSFYEETNTLQPIEKWILGEGTYHLCGLTVKKSFLSEIGEFDVNLYQAQDTDLHYRIALSGKVKYITDPESLIAIRNLRTNGFKLKNGNDYRSIHYLFKKYLFLLDKKLDKKVNRKLIVKYLTSHVKAQNKSKLSRYYTYTKTFLKLIKARPHIIWRLI